MFKSQGPINQTDHRKEDGCGMCLCTATDDKERMKCRHFQLRTLTADKCTHHMFNEFCHWNPDFTLNIHKWDRENKNK